MEAVRRVGEFAARLDEATGGTPELAAAAEQAEAAVKAALFDDLNAPEAMGALFTFIARGMPSSTVAGRTWQRSTRASGVRPDRRGTGRAAASCAAHASGRISDLDAVWVRTEPGRSMSSLFRRTKRAFLEWGEAQLRARQLARRERQFAEADRIRAVLEERGFVVKDAPGGVVMERFS